MIIAICATCLACFLQQHLYTRYVYICCKLLYNIVLSSIKVFAYLFICLFEYQSICQYFKFEYSVK